MASSRPPISSAMKPKFSDHFDTWNSSSTGHQTAENRLNSSVGWRHSRSMKLSHQFKSAATGGRGISDRVGAGSGDWDETTNFLIPKDVKAQARISVANMLVSKKHRIFHHVAEQSFHGIEEPVSGYYGEEIELPSSKRPIFDGLTMYVNGCTKPLISDHKLKYLLAENGAKISIHLSRKQVTHVILGNPCGKPGAIGAGGGLAGSKIQKEIMRTRGCGIRYVSVQWVLESLKAGIRLPEARFANLALASKGQRSVYLGIFKAADNVSEQPIKEFVGNTPDMK